MKVEIWSDVACPWCYIGKRRFERALSGFEGRDGVEVVWRSFELDPGAPAERAEGLFAHLARKYGVGVAQARAMGARVAQAAADEGLAFDFERARTGRTFDAHRLIHLAARRGLGDAMKERLLAAYLCEGALMADRERLVALAVEVGLDAEAVAAALASDAEAGAVRADEARALELGVRGVPFFLVGGAYGVSGAQPPEVLRQVLERAWSEEVAAAVPDAEGCDEEGCAVPSSGG